MIISNDGEDLPGVPHQRAVDKRFRYVCLWLTIFGISMGYFEAAVVADLRAIFCPDNNLFPGSSC